MSFRFVGNALTHCAGKKRKFELTVYFYRKYVTVWSYSTPLKDFFLCYFSLFLLEGEGLLTANDVTDMLERY